MTDIGRKAPEATSIAARLRAVTAVRCLMITLLLGSAILVNINDAKTAENPVNAGLTGLIIGTYFATVVFALWLRSGRWLAQLNHSGLILDAGIATTLVLMTGRFESPFTYFFLIVALYGGVVDGRRSGVSAALYGAIGVGIVLLFELDLVNSSWSPSSEASASPYFRAIWIILATGGVGVLSGFLRERLDAAAAQLEESAQALAERARFVEVLRSDHERILHSLRSGLLTIDGEGLVSYANPACEALLGLRVEEIREHGLDELGIQPADGEKRWERELVRANGDRVVLGFSSAALAAKGVESKGEVITFQDLTLLRSAERRLRAQERLATVGRFAAAIAHEIRNPLASISGSVELLSTETIDDSDKALMRIITREMDRLNSLVRAILDYSTPHSPQRERLDLAEVVREAATLYSHDPMTAGVEHSFSLDESCMTLSDREMLSQILLNLWRNASEAMMEIEPSEKRMRTACFVGDDRRIHLTVEDNGPGVPRDDRDRIFEPFFSNKAGGTGLGLATVYTLSQELGGNAALSELGSAGYAGACFELVLMPDGSGLADGEELVRPVASPRTI